MAAGALGQCLMAVPSLSLANRAYILPYLTNIANHYPREVVQELLSLLSSADNADSASSLLLNISKHPMMLVSTLGPL